MDNKEWFLTITPLLLLKTPLFRPFRSSAAAGAIVQENSSTLRQPLKILRP